jgi:hypothetical protein
MKSHKRYLGAASVALFTLALMPTIAAGQDLSAVQDNGPLHLKGSGSFFVNGDLVFLNGNETSLGARGQGLMAINQMYVQFQKPLAQNGKKHFPLVIVHGGGLDSKQWETTPDGRMGWAEYFVRQGFDTYLADAVSRARSGFDARVYNLVHNGVQPPTAQPLIQLAGDQALWNAFRWGVNPCTASPCSTTDTPHPGIKFPMNTVGVGPGSNNQFFNEGVPDPIATLGPAPADPAGFYNTPAQMALLAQQLGGAILVGQSESASYPTRAALQPGSNSVKGIMQFETGCFGNLIPAEVATLAKIPIIIEYGDFSAVPQPIAPCPTEIAQITAAGGDISFAWLPGLSPNSLYKGSPGPFYGNDHLVMMDTNNLAVADVFIGWINSRGL